MKPKPTGPAWMRRPVKTSQALQPYVIADADGNFIIEVSTFDISPNQLKRRIRFIVKAINSARSP